MVGDINNHYFYPPPPSFIKTLHRLPTTLKVQVKRTLNNPMSRAAAAAHVKKTLQNLCNQIEANKAALFEGRSSILLLSASKACFAIGDVILLRLKLHVDLRLTLMLDGKSDAPVLAGAQMDSEPGTGGDQDGNK